MLLSDWHSINLGNIIYSIHTVSLQVLKPDSPDKDHSHPDFSHCHSVFIVNSFSILQHVFGALFDINFHCSTFYISITNQCEWTNYLISGRWQTDGSIPQELVDSVTASWRFLFVLCENKSMTVVFDTEVEVI